MHAFSTPLRSLHWTTCIGQAAAAARPKPGPLPAQWETDLGILSLVVLARVPDSKGGPTQVLACQEKPGGRSTAKSHAKRLLCAGHPGGGERRGGGEGEGGCCPRIHIYPAASRQVLSSFFTQILFSFLHHLLSLSHIPLRQRQQSSSSELPPPSPQSLSLATAPTPTTHRTLSHNVRLTALSAPRSCLRHGSQPRAPLRSWPVAAPSWPQHRRRRRGPSAPLPSPLAP